MIARIFSTLGAALVAVFLVVLALANRHDARLVLDPFNPRNPALEVSVPFFVFMFALLMLGVLIGGMSVWFSQGKWRKTARQRTQEAMRWKGEVERLSRERDDHVAAAKKLASQSPSQQTGSESMLLLGR